MHRPVLITITALVLTACADVAPPPETTEPALADVQTLFDLRVGSYPLFRSSLQRLDDPWDDRYAVMLLETSRLMRNRNRVEEMRALLEQRTGVGATSDLDEAYAWVWTKNPGVHPEYDEFKARLYERIDPLFAAYFEDAGDDALIRLDEIRWGGVPRDGIPPLKDPAMIAADSDDYLAPTDVVFGIEIDGDARAYPKRILAWHEMFKDTVGGRPVTGVYCTLCGSMILYESVHDGVHHELGTSGFLYRSNKLMYDHATESLWSTMQGAPVVGPLVGQGVELTPRAVVTTTWGEWKRAHPDTQVLSLDTGHRRDYGEGVAYRDYFATDDLMFGVPQRDARLANKAEVLALRFGEATTPVAIDTAFLARTPVHHGTKDDVAYVVLTDPSGANRVYAAGSIRFASYDAEAGTAADEAGNIWRVTEAALTLDARKLERLPAHRAFWFGWFAAHPETELIEG